MMIANINYKGELATGELDKIIFPRRKMAPVQHRIKTFDGSCMLVFPSGKFRLMGVKKPLTPRQFVRLPLLPKSVELQSATIVENLGQSISLITLTNRLTSKRCSFEPELFPAARLLQFNPLCVNVFATGTIVLMGVKDLKTVNKLISNVRTVILDAVN